MESNECSDQIWKIVASFQWYAQGFFPPFVADLEKQDTFFSEMAKDKLKLLTLKHT